MGIAPWVYAPRENYGYTSENRQMEIVAAR